MAHSQNKIPPDGMQKYFFVAAWGLKRGYLDRSKKALFVHFSKFAILKCQEYKINYILTRIIY